MNLLARLRGRPAAAPQDALHPTVMLMLTMGPQYLKEIPREVEDEIRRLWAGGPVALAKAWQQHEQALRAFAQTNRLQPEWGRRGREFFAEMHQRRTATP